MLLNFFPCWVLVCQAMCGCSTYFLAADWGQIKYISRDNLVKTAHRKCGIKPEQVDVSDAALLFLIENYCREAGVRNLQKQIEFFFRKVSSLNIVQNFLTWMPSNLKLYWFINRLLLNLYANNFKSSAEGSIEMLHEYLRLKELE